MEPNYGHKQKKPLLKRASYHLLGLSKRMMKRTINNIQTPGDLTQEAHSEYDNYGFSMDNNQFASGIEIYEKEFEVKKERRLKRWENVPTSEPRIDVDSDEFKLLVRKGIPDHLRPSMWKKLLGADQVMAMNDGIYQKMLRFQPTRDISEQIDLDINRTFPTHKNYKVNSFGTVMLRNVLVAFANYMPAVNYCQSINYLTATLLIFMSEEEAFWCLVQIINSRIPEKGLKIMGYYNNGMLELKRDVLVLEFILKSRLKKLYKHLKANGIDLMWICAEWFLCLFTISLPMTTAVRVWDSLFLEGDKILFRVGFSLFKLHEQRILNLSSDKDLLIYCKTMSKSVLQHDEFLKIAFYNLSSFSRKDIQQYRQEAMKMLE